jgi:hypothetical protein
MRTLQINSKPFYVNNRTTGAVVTGLSTASFTFIARSVIFGASAPSTFTASASIVADATVSGLYWLFFTMPAPGPSWMIKPVPVDSNNVCTPDWWHGELTSQDEDSLLTNLSRASIVDVSNVTAGTQKAIRLNAYRRNEFALTFKTGNTPTDLSLYYQLRLGVRTPDQTTKKLDAYNASPTGFVLTGNSSGILTIVFPSSLGTLGSTADIYSYLASGAVSSDTLYWDVSGCRTSGDETTREQIVKGGSSLIIDRREFGT